MSITLSPDEASDIVFGDNEEWRPIQNTQQEHKNGRWDLYCSIICEHMPTKKFYRFNWTEGATEQQCHAPFEYDGEEIKPIEVIEVEKTIKVWKKV